MKEWLRDAVLEEAKEAGSAVVLLFILFAHNSLLV